MNLYTQGQGASLTWGKACVKCTASALKRGCCTGLFCAGAGGAGAGAADTGTGRACMIGGWVRACAEGGAVCGGCVAVRVGTDGLTLSMEARIPGAVALKSG